MNTKKTEETIYLLESETHRVRATCKIFSTYPISCSDWSEERDNHCIDISYRELKERYKHPYAWVLTDVEEWKDISYYSHPRGAIVWVKDVELSEIDEASCKQVKSKE